MSNETSPLASRAVALAGLGAEFCAVVATAAEHTPTNFCASVVRYLPRIYITANDLTSDDAIFDADDAIFATMDEETYESARQAMAAVFGEYDTFLDTPVEEMRYSDTPVAASLSEKLADVYQQMYDFAFTVRECTTDSMNAVVADFKSRFDSYLSETICDALRAANFILRKNVLDND